MGDNGAWAIARSQIDRAHPSRSDSTDLLAPGVHRVAWWNGVGRPDTFIVAYAARADSSWLRLADIVIQPSQRTIVCAEEIAATSLAWFSGCALCAVHVVGQGYLLRWRDGCRTALRTGAAPADIFWCCGEEYVRRLLGFPTLRPPAGGRADLRA